MLLHQQGALLAPLSRLTVVSGEIDDSCVLHPSDEEVGAVYVGRGQFLRKLPGVILSNAKTKSLNSTFLRVQMSEGYVGDVGASHR